MLRNGEKGANRTVKDGGKVQKHTKTKFKHTEERGKR